MDRLRQMIERQILKALAEGKLQGLEGEGKPLPDRSGEAFVDPAEAAGYRMMAEAGAMPEEFRLKAELDAARKLYAERDDPEEKRQLMALIAELQMRHEIAREARRKFMR